MRKKIGRGAFVIVLLAISTAAIARGASDLKIVFDPKLRPLIHEAIAQSEKTIDVEVFKMTDRGVIADLGRAAGRGIQVRVILCPTQKSNQKAAKKLMQNGVAVRWYPITVQNQIMHIKMGMFDMQRLIFGSPNWTYWGLTIHHEGVLDISQQAVVDEMQARFAMDWKKSRPVESPAK